MSDVPSILAMTLATLLSANGTAAPQARPADAMGELGLYPATAFRLATGACEDCAVIRQARWYFRNEVISVPLPSRPVATFETGVRAFDDLRRWAATRATDAPIDYPSLVWTAAPAIMRGARLGDSGAELVTSEGAIPLRITEKIPLNRSYYDASSIAFFRGRSLTVRGSPSADAFVARSIWPEDFRLGGEAPPMRAMPAGVSASEALRGLMREDPRGGARSPYAAWTLWQRNGAPREWSGRPVLAFMANGAQGDDDEAQAGHFALVTGRVRSDGAIGDWLVNNFYPLDAESEKGILSAPVPLDNYLADLNSGQAWYRPSYMVVAILRDERVAALVQSGLNRLFNQYWRHQLVFYHPNENCTSFSIDTLRTLGWNVPRRGPSRPVMAWLGFPVVAIEERSIAKAKLSFDYLLTDQTRLMPAAALEEAFGSLLALGNGNVVPEDGHLARMLAEDLEALAFVRFPQFPSSRAFGDAPAVTVSEYRKRIPKDPALAQIVPLPPRPFPDELRDDDLIAPPRHLSYYAALIWGAVAVGGTALAIRRWRRPFGQSS